jgi:hypothetical protein
VPEPRRPPFRPHATACIDAPRREAHSERVASARLRRVTSWSST